MTVRSDLPPRLRDWREGTPQVGAFLRTRDGATITLINDKATDDQETLLFAILLGPQKMPPDIMKGLRAWVDSQVTRHKTDASEASHVATA